MTIIFSFGVGIAFAAFSTPSGAPSASTNVPAPINIGTSTQSYQTKVGGFEVGGLWINNSLIVQNGYVSIGTAAPGAKLDVAGQIKITGGSPSAGRVLTSDANGLASWQNPVSGTSTASTAGTAGTAGPQGPAGPAGSQGLVGATGPRSDPKDWTCTMRTGPVGMESSVSCVGKEKVMNGGCLFDHHGNPWTPSAPVNSSPSGTGQGWHCYSSPDYNIAMYYKATANCCL